MWHSFHNELSKDHKNHVSTSNCLHCDVNCCLCLSPEWTCHVTQPLFVGSRTTGCLSRALSPWGGPSTGTHVGDRSGCTYKRKYNFDDSVTVWHMWRGLAQEERGERCVKLSRVLSVVAWTVKDHWGRTRTTLMGSCGGSVRWLTTHWGCHVYTAGLSVPETGSGDTTWLRWKGSWLSHKATSVCLRTRETMGEVTGQRTDDNKYGTRRMLCTKTDTMIDSTSQVNYTSHSHLDLLSYISTI
jgi:hypothetical protein